MDADRGRRARQPYAVTFTASNALSGSGHHEHHGEQRRRRICVGNRDFESAAPTGWGTYGNAALAAVAGRPHGQALQITGSSSFGCDDIPDWIPSPLHEERRLSHQLLGEVA